MSNMGRKENLEQSAKNYLKTQLNWRSNRGDVHLLMKRLKKNQQKQSKEKFLIFVATVGVLIVSGIIISF